MSERQPILLPAPACPVCANETELKRVHREPARDLMIYKCRVCAVEYPVVNTAAR
jgi:uncharacterized protein YbaR (Trm112 family)